MRRIKKNRDGRKVTERGGGERGERREEGRREEDRRERKRRGAGE
jgi:hypothetical protein